MRARMSCQISAIGVRDMVEPPMPTDAPSCTKEAASSSDTTFSRRLRSRRAKFSRSVLIGLNRIRIHAHDLALLAAVCIVFDPATSALNSSISGPTPEGCAAMPSQND